MTTTPPVVPHPSHDLRLGDASTWDYQCRQCHYTDHVPGGWGKLADPCPKAPPVAPPKASQAPLSERLTEIADICEHMKPVGQWPGALAIATLREAAELARGESFPANGYCLRFGVGGWIVDIGTHGGEPTVFLDQAPAAGQVGSSAPDEIKAQAITRFRMLFPTKEQAARVYAALVEVPNV
jgi:hypothetical protein